MVIEVDGVRCGLPATHVVELHPVVRTTPLPGTPDVVEGVINFRGSLVAVLDLRARLGLRRRPPLLSDHLAVTRSGRRLVALRVDRAVELVAVPKHRIESAADLPHTDHISGAAKLDDGVMVIHDLDTFFSADEAASLDGALAGAMATGLDGPGS